MPPLRLLANDKRHMKKMQITRVQAQNIKGRHFNYEIGPVTLIAGPNFSGKSTILDAIQIGLSGFHPSLPKRSNDVFVLASASPMKVAIGFSDDTTNRREWHDVKGSVKTTENLEAVDLIDSESFPMMLNPSEYF